MDVIKHRQEESLRAGLACLGIGAVMAAMLAVYATDPNVWAAAGQAPGVVIELHR